MRILLKEQMIDIETLQDRIRCLDPARAPIACVLAWARRRAIEAST
ncbi:MAG: hypothetical protein H7337_07450 [Rhizobacter sp.]|nr:hypothetical protein [Rhizobacter sp.]